MKPVNGCARQSSKSDHQQVMTTGTTTTAGRISVAPARASKGQLGGDRQGNPPNGGPDRDPAGEDARNRRTAGDRTTSKMFPAASADRRANGRVEAASSS